MKIIIENEYQGIRIETNSECYEADIRRINPNFWKWVKVSYDPDTTTFTRQGNIVRRITIVNGRTIYADWTQYFEFSGCDADENPMECIIRMIDKDFMKNKVFTLWIDCTTLGHFNTLSEALKNVNRVEKYIKENPDALEEGEPRIYEYEYDHMEGGIMYTGVFTGAFLMREYDLNGMLTHDFYEGW